jgi:hypothetical protein
MLGNLKTLAAPLMIIALGIGWLLTTQNIMPGVNWIWVAGLGITGLVILLVAGVDKVTIVVGPFLMISTFFSILRQTGRLSIDSEAPILFITFGVLMLIAKLLPVPLPKWIIEPEKGKAK